MRHGRVVELSAEDLHKGRGQRHPYTELMSASEWRLRRECDEDRTERWKYQRRFEAEVFRERAKKWLPGLRRFSRRTGRGRSGDRRVGQWQDYTQEGTVSVAYGR